MAQLWGQGLQGAAGVGLLRGGGHVASPGQAGAVPSEKGAVTPRDPEG